jgi:membrane protein DedA with SNARE-associated domain
VRLRYASVRDNLRVFQSLVDLVTASDWTYLVLFAVAALDAVFPVVPSETAVITAGVLAASGRLDLSLVVLSAAAGAWIGDNTSYLVGNRLGTPVARRYFRGERAQRRLGWARHQLDVRGAIVILLARFVPGGRTAVTFTAGLVRYPWKTRFLPFSLLAGLFWALYASLVGYLGGRVFEEKPLYGLLLAFGIAGTVALTYEVIRRWRGAQ